MTDPCCLLGIAGLIYIMLISNGLRVAMRRGALFWTDVLAPMSAVFFWFVLTAYGYGHHQSIANIDEIGYALLCSLLVLYLRLYALDYISKNYKMNSYVAFLLSLSCVFLIRAFTPFFPE